MKKSIKIILIILSLIVFFIFIDTIQAIVLKNSPLISLKENLGEKNYIKKGLLVDVYYCNEDDTITTSTHFKTEKFTCPLSTDDVSNDTEKIDFYIEKSNENRNTLKLYAVYDNRNIYMTKKIKELYIITANNKVTLKEFLSSDTLDNVIKKLTDNLELYSILKDGGSAIYKSKDKDLSIVVCNTIDGNHNINIGNYEFDNYECV